MLPKITLIFDILWIWFIKIYPYNWYVLIYQLYLSIKFHRYIGIYRFLRYIENFWNFSKFYEIFDILIFNISRYIANLIYQNISFCDISRYIVIYRPIYRYIAIYRFKNVIFAVTFCFYCRNFIFRGWIVPPLISDDFEPEGGV